MSDLAAFTQTDLRDDEQLRPLLESRPPGSVPGSGHRFDLDEDAFTLEPRSFAAEMRRYLRLAG